MKMKYMMRITTTLLAIVVVCLLINKNLNISANSQLKQIDEFTAEQNTNDYNYIEIKKTSYSDYAEERELKFKAPRYADRYAETETMSIALQPDEVVEEIDVTEEETTELFQEESLTEEQTEEYIEELDINSMDIWTLGSHLYGISELDTTRSLILITYEGYGADSLLSYYVACCCWNRCVNGYFGNSDLYTSFGGMDESYNTQMDYLSYDAYAIDVLRQCYLNPSYVTSCNGMECPEEYVYAEWDGNNIIYVW